MAVGEEYHCIGLGSLVAPHRQAWPEIESALVVADFLLACAGVGGSTPAEIHHVPDRTYPTM